MVLQLPPLSILLPFSLLIFSIAIKAIKRRKCLYLNTKTKLPPGPWKLPLIGNIHQLISSLPHQTLRDLAKKHGPLMHLQLGELSTLIVSSADMAKEVLITNGTNFADRPYIFAIDFITYHSRDIAMAPYGDYWRQLRKICTLELLTVKRVRSFRSIRKEEVSDVIKSIAASDGCPVNLTKKIFCLTYGITARAMFGKKCKGQETYASMVEEIIKLSSGFSLADMYPSVELFRLIGGMRKKLKTLFQQSDGILQDILNQKREAMEKGEVNEDLVSVLLKVQQLGQLEFPLTDTDIKAVVWDIFTAGSETSPTVVDWAMAEMMKNPRVLEKAQTEVRQVFHGKQDVEEANLHELKYMTLVIKETLRLHPAVPLLFPRECRKDCVINGFDIPAKTKVMINAWAMSRDPDNWNEPDRFYPERFLNCFTDFRGSNLEFIPFGAGRRICPGITFAMANIEFPLSKLLYHFDWKFPNKTSHENVDMAESFGVTMRRKQDLILIPTNTLVPE